MRERSSKLHGRWGYWGVPSLGEGKQMGCQMGSQSKRKHPTCHGEDPRIEYRATVAMLDCTLVRRTRAEFAFNIDGCLDIRGREQVSRNGLAHGAV